MVVPTLRPTADQREALERETTSPLSLIVEPVFCRTARSGQGRVGFCATKWSLDGEDRSAKSPGRERGLRHS